VSAAHFQNPGPAPPGWGNSQQWHVEGATPSVSFYEVDLPGDLDNPFWSEIKAGIKRAWERLPLSAPTITRANRVGSQFSSVPAAVFFNQLGNASGTGRNFSPGAVASVPHQMNKDNNPGAYGSAELHPATSYEPFPAPGALYPKVV
jgi:hypothetical protein